MSADEEDDRPCVVLLNDEGQYSLWLSGRPIPAGWRKVGPEGPRTKCLEYIERVWSDMRPLSLQRRMRRTESTKDEN